MESDTVLLTTGFTTRLFVPGQGLESTKTSVCLKEKKRNYNNKLTGHYNEYIILMDGGTESI